MLIPRYAIGHRRIVTATVVALMVAVFALDAMSAPLKVALLTPGPISDDGWNASAYEGLELIREELGAQVAHRESRNQGEFRRDFRDYARRGYNLIFAHGYEFSTHARDIADAFPETYFVTTGGEAEYARANYAPIVFVLDDGMYLLGVLAGKMTNTGKLGFVGGQELPPVSRGLDAFIAGAKSVRDDVEVLTAYVGNWEDALKAREQAAAQIQEGADFLLHNADKAGLGVFQAVDEARKAGGDVYAFGSNRDQNHVNPDVILASAVSDIPKGFVDMARRAESGEFEGALRFFTLQGGWIHVVYNPDLIDRIPADVMTSVEDAEARLRAGDISLTAPESDAR
ncbi:BMP family protein [Candidatus Poribacteria bacterium]|jgi:basic membrane protein A and related proteins|nr:BMP family protein [Candidatus Poribacteria bacterium]MBT5714042.1 BMP family protein [Candidatus Poribacteria bacterium]MBT7099397.1 BMP family protein [Candidatus Poribacteria bacterium]MBT7805926.1 BMP family protein [Candidatus Poribacteria bacterium]